MSVSGNSFEPVLVTPLRSPAARKRARAQAQLAWRRLAVRLLVGGVLAAGVVRVGTIALEPLVATFRSGREIQGLEAEYRAELARQAHLQGEIRFLSTPAGIEEAARGLGWVKEGETSLQLVKPELATKTEKMEVGSSSRQSGSERLKEWIARLFPPQEAAPSGRAARTP
jgi:hypothetical protein